MYTKLSLILLFCLTIAACANRYEEIEVSRFVLEKNIVIKPGYQQAYIQDGHITAPIYLNPYDPYCALVTSLDSELNTIKHIDAGEFIINGINENSNLKSYSNSSGQKESAMYSSEILLSSDQQAYVLSLNCFRWTAFSQKRNLSLSEIKQIMATVGRFEQ